MKQIALDFIGSRDVREHLEKTGYVFSSAETAFIIDHCRKSTMEARHRAFQEIIDTMPDCEIQKRRNFEYCPSLHALLRDYMSYQNALLERVQQPSAGHVYQFSYREDGRSCDEKHIFRTFQECMDYAKWLLKYTSDDGVMAIEEFSIIRRAFYHSRSGKESAYSSYINATYDNKLELLSVSYFGWDDEAEAPEGAQRLEEPFLGLWFDIPTPFKKGDIIINPTSHFESFPMVYLGRITDPVEGWTDERYKEFLEHLKNDADESDMNYRGLSVAETGSAPVWTKTYLSYLDIEYYRGELTDEKRILSTFSSYYKGEIGEELLVNAVTQICLESLIKSMKGSFEKVCVLRDFCRKGTV